MMTAKQITALADLSAQHTREKIELRARFANDQEELLARHQKELQALQAKLMPKSVEPQALSAGKKKGK